MRVIAGIGARLTPAQTQLHMIAIGEWCSQNNIWVRSGHAEGADFAFEQGAQHHCIAYLPWPSFNKELKPNMGQFTGAKLIVPRITQRHKAISAKHHPKYHGLSQGVQKLMDRNVCQVLGENLISPVTAVVCWTKDGNDSGGTGQAIRIAWDHEIPVINMKEEQYHTAAQVISQLTELFPEKS